MDGVLQGEVAPVRQGQVRPMAEGVLYSPLHSCSLNISKIDLPEIGESNSSRGTHEGVSFYLPRTYRENRFGCPSNFCPHQFTHSHQSPLILSVPDPAINFDKNCPSEFYRLIVHQSLLLLRSCPSNCPSTLH